MAKFSPLIVPIGLVMALLVLSIECSTGTRPSYLMRLSRRDTGPAPSIEQAVLDADEVNNDTSDYYPRTLPIVHLNSTNFNSTIHCNLTRLWTCRAAVVHFYSKASAYDALNSLAYKAASILTRDWGPVLKLAAVDCDVGENVAICRQHGFESGMEASLFKYFKHTSRPTDRGQIVDNFYDAEQLSRLYVHDKPQFINQSASNVRKFLQRIIRLIEHDHQTNDPNGWLCLESFPEADTISEVWQKFWSNVGAPSNTAPMALLLVDDEIDGFLLHMRALTLINEGKPVCRIHKGHLFTRLAQIESYPQVWEIKYGPCASGGLKSRTIDGRYELQVCQDPPTTTIDPEMARMEEDLAKGERALKHLYAQLRPLAESVIAEATTSEKQTDENAAQIERFRSFIQRFDPKYGPEE